MKKFVSLIIIIAASSYLWADFKIMTGFDLSKYQVMPRGSNIHWKHKLGFLGGIGLEKNITEKILLELNIIFCQKGTIASQNLAEIGEVNWKYRLNVVSLPLLLRSQFKEASSPYLVGGFELASILSHTEKFSGQEPVDIKDNTVTFDLAFILGVGYQIQLQEDLFFFIEGRYSHGLKNIIISPLPEQIWKTRTFIILIGVRS
ncbi:MAG: porin family protein [Candidatus Aminicenantales bacterium]